MYFFYGNNRFSHMKICLRMEELRRVRTKLMSSTSRMLKDKYNIISVLPVIEHRKSLTRTRKPQLPCHGRLYSNRAITAEAKVRLRIKHLPNRDSALCHRFQVKMAHLTHEQNMWNEGNNIHITHQFVCDNFEFNYPYKLYFCIITRSEINVFLFLSVEDFWSNDFP